MKKSEEIAKETIEDEKILEEEEEMLCLHVDHLELVDASGVTDAFQQFLFL